MAKQTQIEASKQRIKELEYMLLKTYTLLSNMPLDLHQTDSMTLLWIAERDTLIKSIIDDSSKQVG